jgi:hypothetical protein
MVRLWNALSTPSPVFAPQGFTFQTSRTRVLDAIILSHFIHPRNVVNLPVRNSGVCKLLDNVTFEGKSLTMLGVVVKQIACICPLNSPHPLYCLHTKKRGPNPRLLIPLDDSLIYILHLASCILHPSFVTCYSPSVQETILSATKPYSNCKPSSGLGVSNIGRWSLPSAFMMYSSHFPLRSVKKAM